MDYGGKSDELWIMDIEIFVDWIMKDKYVI